MHEKKFTIFGSHATKSAVERAAEIIFTACGLLAVVAVFSITLYMIISGTPALFKVGVPEILFGTVWKPTGNPASFGILYVILTSIVGTFLAILIGVPIGLFTAIFLAEVAPPKVAAVVRPAVELLAGIPSVIYGLLGILILNPLMYKLEMKIFAGSTTHQFTGGANLISAVLVLARRDSSQNQTSCLPMRVLSSLTQRAKCSVPSEICFWRKVMFCAFLT